MMPAPGFQKPMPYLFDTDARKSKTSLLLVDGDSARSATAPAFAWIRWSQCTVAGHGATFWCGPACMNWSSAICAVASCMATRSGAKST
jgi:hypothetical protein